VPSPHKFIRDNIDVSDIDGTKPNPKYFRERNQDIYTEIEGSRPRVKKFAKDHFDNLNVRDINEY
jgi:hypothetical protein